MIYKKSDDFKTRLAQLFMALITTVLVLSGKTVAESDSLTNAEDFFDISFGDLPEELIAAQDDGKQGLLIMFEMDDCPWCERMKQQVLNRISVHDYFHEHFRVITVDVEGDVPVVGFDGEEMPSKDFALKVLRVRATPVFVFFDFEGKELARYTGAVKNPHDFILLGRFVVEDHYLSTRYNQFRRANQPG